MNFKLKIFTTVLFVLAGMNSFTMAENDANIVVAAEGDVADALISKFAARSPYFLFFNEQGTLIEALANPYHRESRGTGPQVVDFLYGKGVHTVIAGEFGVKMITAMRQKNMTYNRGVGRAEDAVRRLQNP
jgi:predicted Fe-Mo cluster-binding NifX family protein